MLKKIALVLVLLVVAFFIFVATRPSEFRIARSIKISAPPAEVFAHVNDFHKWDAWSPWVKVDPAAKVTFEGPAEGEGAIFKWAGNNEVGEGSMLLTESKPNEFVRIQLNFLKPFAGTAQSEFTFKPEGDQTMVTWSMAGKNNFVAKAVCLFMDCDKMIGDKYNEGLASMKSVVEGKKSTQEGSP